MNGDGGGYKTIAWRWPERELFFIRIGLRPAPAFDYGAVPHRQLMWNEGPDQQFFEFVRSRQNAAGVRRKKNAQRRRS
jgi:hypothetical protein